METKIKILVKALDIKEESKQLLSQLICAELFRAIYMSYRIEDITIVKYEHDNENDTRVWAKCSIFVDFENKIAIYPFRPFIDTCEIVPYNNKIQITRTYFLYD